MCQQQHDVHICQCPGGKTERYLQPTLLLALYLKSSYGYDLIGKLNDFGFMDGSADPGTVYSHLRRLEDDGFVSSKWDTSGAGPARRFYEITPEGEILLNNWAMFMERNYNNIEKFLDRYRKTSETKK